MKKKLIAFAEQLLIVANIFIVFLLVFENKLVVPKWLQPVGRMHPLLIHFPIVLLILAVVINLFRFGITEESNRFYLNLSQKLLLAGALLAAITVLMGLFLSREEGYAGNTLEWHKWTGVGTFFLASILYWINKTLWQKPFSLKIGGALIVLALIITGHYGASLSHGENFIMQPVIADEENKVVPIEQAIVFDDVIRPILKKKCASCHNPDKMKGELILADSLSILKGGKSGKLFVPGDPEMSLLIQRIHLPLEEKKHMPPEGKPQLTEQEALLLELWIDENTEFSKKVVDLPATDSLRIAATVFLQAPISDEKFEFAEANEKTIEKLNTNYRTIRPIAKGSPALTVDVFNAAAYSSKQLSELAEIKKQIVSLNLDKLPVTDDDIKSIAEFENLRKLELNFTNITAKGLKELAALKNLHTLTVSGTRLTYQDLKEQIPSMKGLKTISVWNTGLSESEAGRLQKDNTGVAIITGFKEGGRDTLTLNPPQVKNSTLVFDKNIMIQLKHPIKGVEIRYTLDGSMPDSIKSPVFDNTTEVDKTTSVKAKAYKEGWHSSDVITFDFLKSTFKPDSAILLYPLNNVHLADGAHTFFDTKLGVIGANNPAWANYWAGVRNNDLGVVSLFKNPVTISSVGIHYMVEEATGIYPPAEVEVWGGENEKQLKLLVKMKPPLPKKKEPPSLRLVEGQFKPQQVSCLKIIAKPYVKKKDRYLLLVDEMLLN
ncbi:MAG: chitobiase/beta-hexosaminidase C-terminal domain-containing protein [Bacteroidetes bacterium]|nr:chitobiase/beta-hexosaminidase C-terminal domain-containing protein [Bacteroidota bacterium]